MHLGTPFWRRQTWKIGIKQEGKGAHLVEMSLALVRAIDSTLRWRRSRSRDTETSGQTEPVGRLVQEARPALAGVSLREVLAIGVLMAVVFPETAFVDQSGATDPSRTAGDVGRLVNEVIPTTAGECLLGVDAVRIGGAVMPVGGALVYPEETATTGTVDRIRREVDELVRTGTHVAVLRVGTGSLAGAVILPCGAFIHHYK